MPTPRLETERLILRGFREEDREPFAALNADPEVMRFMSRRLNREQSDGLLERIALHWAADGFGIWALERRSDSEFLGFAGLSEPSFTAHFTPAVEVGWRLARSAWGHGYATEAGAAALRFGFEVLGRDEIVSFTAADNIRSRRVMERLRMTHDPADDFSYPLVPIDHPVSRTVLYRLSRARFVETAL